MSGQQLPGRGIDIGGTVGGTRHTTDDIWVVPLFPYIAVTSRHNNVTWYDRAGGIPVFCNAHYGHVFFVAMHLSRLVYHICSREHRHEWAAGLRQMADYSVPNTTRFGPSGTEFSREDLLFCESLLALG